VRRNIDAAWGLRFSPRLWIQTFRRGVFSDD
jgi:hypothetical protein